MSSIPDTPKKDGRAKNGGARKNAGRAGSSVRNGVLAYLDEIGYSPLENLVKAANDARQRLTDDSASESMVQFDRKLAKDIDQDLLSYQIAKPRAKQEIAVTANPVKELMEQIWEESKEE